MLLVTNMASVDSSLRGFELFLSFTLECYIFRILLGDFSTRARLSCAVVQTYTHEYILSEALLRRFQRSIAPRSMNSWSPHCCGCVLAYYRQFDVVQKIFFGSMSVLSRERERETHTGARKREEKQQSNLTLWWRRRQWRKKKLNFKFSFSTV